MVAQIIKNQIDKIEHREKQIVWGLFLVFALLLVSYGFLVNRTILNAVAKQNLEKQMSALNSSVDSLEFTYLNMENTITMDLATAKGFVAVAEDNFAVVTPAKGGVALSFNEN